VTATPPETPPQGVHGEERVADGAAFAFRPDSDGVLVYQAGKENEGVRFTRV